MLGIRLAQCLIFIRSQFLQGVIAHLETNNHAHLRGINTKIKALKKFLSVYNFYLHFLFC